MLAEALQETHTYTCARTCEACIPILSESQRCVSIMIKHAGGTSTGNTHTLARGHAKHVHIYYLSHRDV
jgi:hypothetical protein